MIDCLIPDRSRPTSSIKGYPCLHVHSFFLGVAVTLALSQLDIEGTIVIWAADVIQRPFPRAVGMALTFAKERQHRSLVHR